PPTAGAGEATASPPAPDDVPGDSTSLPPELLLQIFGRLKAMGHLKSLARCASVSSLFHSLVMPVLLWSLVVNGDHFEAFEPLVANGNLTPLVRNLDLSDRLQAEEISTCLTAFRELRELSLCLRHMTRAGAHRAFRHVLKMEKLALVDFDPNDERMKDVVARLKLPASIRSVALGDICFGLGTGPLAINLARRIELDCPNLQSLSLWCWDSDGPFLDHLAQKHPRLVGCLKTLSGDPYIPTSSLDTRSSCPWIFSCIGLYRTRHHSSPWWK
ncbi:hypothetical protein DFJ74DRAFT_727726, partial [Hyaloraphidium curvatum]